MSNHEVSGEMKFNNHIDEVMSLIRNIMINALFAARNGWEKEREPDPQIQAAVLELVSAFSKFDDQLREIDKAFIQYADLVDAMDLWMGYDSGPDGVIREYHKLIEKRNPGHA